MPSAKRSAGAKRSASRACGLEGAAGTSTGMAAGGVLQNPPQCRSITTVAARALGRPELGRLQIGGPADFVAVHPAPGEPATAAALIQHLAGVDPALVVADGQPR